MIILKGIFISTLSNDVIIFYDFYKRINISCHHKWNGCNKNVLPYEMRTNIFQALRSYK